MSFLSYSCTAISHQNWRIINIEEGAFALIDCLGFKGIWTREDPRLVVDKLRKISATVKEQVYNEKRQNLFFNNKSFFRPDEIEVKVGFFSDTVFISLQFKRIGYRPDPDLDDASLVKDLCGIVIKILDLFIQDKPHLTLRGCISYGKFIAEGNFYAGPAVDTAAEGMDIADGAFVWLHETAASNIEVWNSCLNEMYAGLLLGENLIPSIISEEEAEIWIAPETIKYQMPIKNNKTLECYVLNPLSIYETEEKRREIMGIYEKEMDMDRIDVRLKQRNTMAFLNQADHTSNLFHQISKKFNSGLVSIGFKKP